MLRLPLCLALVLAALATPLQAQTSEQLANTMRRQMNRSNQQFQPPPPTDATSALAGIESALIDFDPSDCPRSLARLASLENDLVQASDPLQGAFWSHVSLIRQQIAAIRAACNRETAAHQTAGTLPPVTGAPPGSPPHRPEEAQCETQCRPQFDAYRQAEAALERAARAAADTSFWAASGGNATAAQAARAQAAVVAAERALATAHAAYLACINACAGAPGQTGLGTRQKERLFRGSIPLRLPGTFTPPPPPRTTRPTPAPAPSGTPGQPTPDPAPSGTPARPTPTPDPAPSGTPTPRDRRVGNAPRLVAPAGAFAGGTIGGTVYTEEGTPHAGQPVTVATLTGVVITETETDPEGQYAAETPASGDSLLVTVADGLGRLIETAVPLLQGPPAWATPGPPDFAPVGEPVSLQGVYPEADLAMEGAEPQAVATAWARGPNGESLTTLLMPEGPGPGPAELVLRDEAGQETRTRVGLYRLVAAEIDQNSLRSGQDAAFVYVFDFGPGGPDAVEITVDVTEAVSYGQNGQPQRIAVGPDGRAELRGSVRARQGSPSGVPFAITPTLRALDN